MNKLFANLIASFVPNQKLRRKLRQKLQGNRAVSEVQKYSDIVCRKLSLIQNEDTWTLPNGVKFCLPLYPWDSISRIIVDTDDFFERDILDGLLPYIQSDGIILDIGANIGNHAIFWAMCNGARKIYCFEPIQRTYGNLIRNIKINLLEGVIFPYNMALGDRHCSGEIAAHYATNTGGTSIKATHESRLSSLRIERLDDIDFGCDRICFCKIDVEGFELQTLAGMKNTLKKHRPTVFIEAMESGCGYALPPGFQSTAPLVRDFFLKLGYKYEKIFPPYNHLFTFHKS
jgi:FkbM family methyltransferase